KRLGVKLEDVFGTGPNGRIMRRDIERHVELSGRGMSDSREPPLLGPGRASAATAVPPRERAEEPADPDDWERIPIRGVRRITAERMHRSKSTAAHFTYVEEIDMTEVEAKRKELESQGQAISPLAFIAFAAVKALPAFPLLNASLDDERGEIVLKRRIHLGIATATDEGLLVPVVRDAQLLSFFDLAAAIRDLAAGARKKSLPPAALTGGTFTITSLGKLGGVLATPVINHPESAILSVHAIRELPRYIDGELHPRAIMNLAMSLDHRIVDGIECARFIREVKRHLE